MHPPFCAEESKSFDVGNPIRLLVSQGQYAAQMMRLPKRRFRPGDRRGAAAALTDEGEGGAPGPLSGAGAELEGLEGMVQKLLMTRLSQDEGGELPKRRALAARPARSPCFYSELSSAKPPYRVLCAFRTRSAVRKAPLSRLGLRTDTGPLSSLARAPLP